MREERIYQPDCPDSRSWTLRNNAFFFSLSFSFFFVLDSTYFHVMNPQNKACGSFPQELLACAPVANLIEYQPDGSHWRSSSAVLTTETST